MGWVKGKEKALSILMMLTRSSVVGISLCASMCVVAMGLETVGGSILVWGRGKILFGFGFGQWVWVRLSVVATWPRMWHLVFNCLSI